MLINTSNGFSKGHRKFFLFSGILCKHCSKRFISSDAYKKHRHDNHIVKSITINGQNVIAYQCKQQKAKGKRFHYHCFKCFKPVLKFNYKKGIVICKVEPTKYENGRVSKKPNFQPSSFSFSPAIETSTPESFNKFDLTTPKLNQNVSNN